MKKILLLILLVCISSISLADSNIGDVVTTQLRLGKRSFALPPGKWIVIAERENRSSIDGGGNGAKIKNQYLVQQDESGKFIASARIGTTLASTNVSSWNDSTCDRKDVLFRDTLDGNFRYPACNVVNHVTNFLNTDVPTDDYAKSVWTWFRTNKVPLPYNTIFTSYVKYFSGDFVQVSFWFNPEAVGLIDSDKKAWGQSPWHPELIKTDPARTAYIDQVKQWNTALIKNSRATLMDDKPLDPTLPALPGNK
jgi:hypothetical protein